MACNCSKSGHLETLRLLNTQPVDGMYQFMFYPDCPGPHRGAYQGYVLYVVARFTKDEFVFNKDELVEASDYAKRVHAPMEALATADACDLAVVDAYEMPLADREALYDRLSMSV